MCVRGRLVYSANPEELAHKAQVIFLAEDSPQGLEELVVRLSSAGGPLPGAIDCHSGARWLDREN